MRRVLALVILLDRAKAAKVLSSDPASSCPCTPSRALGTWRRSSRAHSYRGVGDLNKHLGLLGVTLSHKQTALHEFNYGVTSLATDLRDGVRLCKLVDIATAVTTSAVAEGDGARDHRYGGDRGAASVAMSLVAAVPCPPPSRTNKLRNVARAIDCAAQAGALPAATDDVSRENKALVKLLVDGHCETTLDVLWSLLSRCVCPSSPPPTPSRARSSWRAARPSAPSRASASPATLLSLALDASSARASSRGSLPSAPSAASACMIWASGCASGVSPRSSCATTSDTSSPTPPTHSSMPPRCTMSTTRADRAVAGGKNPPPFRFAGEAEVAATKTRRGAGWPLPLPPPSPRWVACRPSLRRRRSWLRLRSHVASLLLGCLFSRLTEVGKQ